jgi:hypothetical protein
MVIDAFYIGGISLPSLFKLSFHSVSDYLYLSNYLRVGTVSAEKKTYYFYFLNFISQYGNLFIFFDRAIYPNLLPLDNWIFNIKT